MTSDDPSPDRPVARNATSGRPSQGEMTSAAANPARIASTDPVPAQDLPMWQRRMPQIMTVATLVAVGVVLVVPGSRDFVMQSAGYLVELDFEGLAGYLREFGSSAWALSSVLMIAQSLAAPIPAVPITLANAMIYGPWWGTLLSWGSAQLAALLCFYLARGLGRPFVERLFPGRQLGAFDRFFERYGVLAIVVSRLIPIVSFDVISYGAGVTRIRALPFFVATGIGQLPASVVYSFAGAELVESPSRALFLAFTFVGVVVAIAGVVFLRSRRAAASGDAT